MQLSHLPQCYKRPELSDVVLCIKLHRSEPEQGGDERPAKRARDAADVAAAVGEDDGQVLTQFPAHRLVLFGTDYFQSQAQQAWAATAATINSPGRDAAVPAGSSCPRLYLPVDSAEQLPAAEAVVAALCDVPGALSNLEQHQLVDAVVLADKLGAPKVAKHAVDALTAAAEDGEGLTAAAAEALASLTAWPDCLHPLLLPVVRHASCCDAGLAELAAIRAADTNGRVQRMLLAVLGDLEAVWKELQLQGLLYRLPVPAMQLLLSSDQLRVASEDTVLHTASKYAALPFARMSEGARSALAVLVRAPHLSRSGLAGQVLSSGHRWLLASLAAPLKLLASYKLGTATERVTADALASIPDAPASWSLGVRQRAETDGARLVWRLPVEQVAQACRVSFAGNKTVVLKSTTNSVLLGGVAWNLQLWVKTLQGGVSGVTAVALRVTANEAPLDVFRVYSATILCGEVTIKTVTNDHGIICKRGRAHPIFEGPMSAGGGWDEAAWAARGLPTSGDLELGLHMHSVG